MRKQIDNPRPSTIATREWRLSHPEETRVGNLVRSRKFRKEHPEKWNPYFAEYYKRWLANPLNKRCHNTRQYLNALKTDVRKKVPFGEKRLQVLQNLYDVGWKIDLPSDLALNHRVSIYWLYSFNIKLPFSVVFDKLNMEVCSRYENNGIAKRTVTEDTIKLAKKLEKRHPEWLTGFGEFMAKNLGEKR